MRQGRVLVNGDICTDLATRIIPGHDRVVVDGEPAEAETETSILLNKPRGYLCTRSDPEHRPTIYDLLPPHLQHLHHVGRLDNESQGLIVLTNSGSLTATLTHPRHAIEKEYLVTLNQAFDLRFKEKLLKGVATPEGVARAHALDRLSPRRYLVILRQGLKRQIRHMFAAVGYKVTRLDRIRIGDLIAPNLPQGKWRLLTREDCEKLTRS